MHHHAKNLTRQKNVLLHSLFFDILMCQRHSDEHFMRWQWTRYKDVDVCQGARNKHFKVNCNLFFYGIYRWLSSSMVPYRHLQFLDCHYLLSKYDPVNHIHSKKRNKYLPPEPLHPYSDVRFLNPAVCKFSVVSPLPLISHDSSLN